MGGEHTVVGRDARAGENPRASVTHYGVARLGSKALVPHQERRALSKPTRSRRALSARSTRRLVARMGLVAVLAGASLVLPDPAHGHGAAPTTLTCEVGGSLRTDLSEYSIYGVEGLICTGSYEGSEADLAVYTFTARGATRGLMGGPETCAGGLHDGDGAFWAQKESGSPHFPYELNGTVAFDRIGDLATLSAELEAYSTGHAVHLDALIPLVPNLSDFEDTCVSSTANPELWFGFSGAPGTMSDELPLVREIPPDVDRRSDDCDTGQEISDNTTEGVHSKLYVIQPEPDQLDICARVEQVPSEDGYGGKLSITPSGLDPDPETPGTPTTDTASSACTTTTSPPNQVPGTHPMTSGSLAGTPYVIDAYANDSEAWLCLRVGSSHTRVIVALGPVDPGISLGHVATWYPDPGTP